MDHLASKNVELGGLLLGTVTSLNNLSEGIVSVQVRDCIESCDFDSTSVSLSMDSTVWRSVSNLSSAEKFVVGWYHSHPNLGAFFSGVDRNTQKSFFNSAYSLGLVVDPIRHEEKWFVGGDSYEISGNNVIKILDDTE